jgi:hypothetical protein
MKKIRITSVTSVADGAGHRYNDGQVAEVDETLATAWIAAGHAEPYTATKRETGKGKPAGRRQATNTPPRNTATKAARATSAEAGKNADADADADDGNDDDTSASDTGDDDASSD